MKALLRIFVAGTAAIACTGTSLFAELTAYDGCRIESGYSETAGGDGRVDAQKLSTLHGWDSLWSLPKTDRSPNYLFREAAGLQYPAITYPGGGGIQITPADNSAQTLGRRLVKSLPMKGNNAIYASFLLSVSEKKDRGMAYVLFTGVGGLGAGISDGNLMVLDRQDSVPDENGKIQKEWVPIASQPYQPNTPYYFILKISDDGDGWAGQDAMSMWINPKDVSSESTASAKALDHNADTPCGLGAPSGAITSFLLHTENLQGVGVKMDEFRVGPTWESVTGPVSSDKGE